jgi:hypothetical protein
MTYPTSGDFLYPGASPTPPPGAERKIGIVSRDPDRVLAYLDALPVGPYVVIRDVADVPAELGGLALLDDEPVPLDLAEALSRALLNEG